MVSETPKLDALYSKLIENVDADLNTLPQFRQLISILAPNKHPADTFIKASVVILLLVALGISPLIITILACLYPLYRTKKVHSLLT